VSTTGIFLEPTGSLRDSLVAAKEALAARAPRAAYTSHPPHCTVLHGVYGNSDGWLEPLRRRLAGFPGFLVRTTGWVEFRDDPLAGGGHTLGYRLELSSSLAELQLVVADCLAPFAKQPGAHPLRDLEPYASSLRRFGFPFVGPHWIPHCTIGSPGAEEAVAIIPALKRFPIHHVFRAEHLSVWAIDGDRHVRRHELALRPRAGNDAADGAAR
jgi:hypothetical protein